MTLTGIPVLIEAIRDCGAEWSKAFTYCLGPSLA
jgi:hypothetical protein